MCIKILILCPGSWTWWQLSITLIWMKESPIAFFNLHQYWQGVNMEKHLSFAYENVHRKIFYPAGCGAYAISIHFVNDSFHFFRSFIPGTCLDVELLYKFSRFQFCRFFFSYFLFGIWKFLKSYFHIFHFKLLVRIQKQL